MKIVHGVRILLGFFALLPFASGAFAQVASLPEAVRRGASISEVKEMVVQGADINQRDSSGRTALSLALESGLVPIVRFLLKHGAAIAAVSPVPAVRADLDFATDVRFLDSFFPRVLSQQLLEVSGKPKQELDSIEQTLGIVPIAVTWTVSCKNGCKGSSALSGNQKKEFAGIVLSQSERTDTAGAATFTASIPKHAESDVPGNDMGAQIARRVVREGIWTIRGQGTLTKCAFSFDKPYCYPEAKIQLHAGSVGALMLRQNAFAARLTPGQSITMDRSEGDISLEVEPVEGKNPLVKVEVNYTNRRPLDIGDGFDPTTRMRAYSALTRMKAAREASLRIGNRESLVEAKMLTTSIREHSATLSYRPYRDVVNQLFLTRAADVLALDRQVLELRKVMQAQLTFPEQDLQLLIDTLDSIGTGDAALGEQLRQVRDALVEARETAIETGAATGIALDGLFSNVDRILGEYQSLGLELAQFVPVAELEASLPSPLAKRELAARLASEITWLPNEAFGGRGLEIRRALALPK